MRRPRILETFGAGALALAVVVAPVLGAAPVSTAEAADVVWFSDGFEDGTQAPFAANAASLAVVDSGAHEGARALSVTGRTAGWNGVKLDLLGAGLEAGTYTISAWVKLAADAPAATTGMHLTVEQTPAADGADQYKLVGDYQEPVGKTDWVQVGGTYTLTEARTAAALYVDVQAQTVGESTVHPSFLLDDVVITGAAVERDIQTTSFEDGVNGWGPRGTAAVAAIAVDATAAHDGTHVLAVTERGDQGWHSAQVAVPASPVPASYAVEAYVRLAPGASPSEANLGLSAPGHPTNENPWVGGRSAVTADGWTFLSGTYTVDPSAPPAYINVEVADAGVPFWVDSVRITAIGTAATPGDDWVPDLDGFVLGGAVAPTATPVTAARGSGLVTALTFDDGPQDPETSDLLDVLAANDVTATFCLIGSQIANPGGAALVQRMVAEGHTLCAHSTGWSSMDTMTRDAIQADLKANIAAIRAAVGDPTYPVPYFRAPNVAWGDGRVGEVAAALGMQPIGLGNPIMDWDGNDLSEATLTANLRSAITGGAIVTAHVGGGDRSGTVAAAATVIPEKLAAGYEFTLPQGGLPAGLQMEFDFEDNTLQGWVARDSQGTPTVEVTDADAHGGTYAASVSDRGGQGDGLLYDFGELLETGVEYEISAWVKLAPGEASNSIVLSMQVAESGDGAFQNLQTLAGVTDGEWVELSTSYTYSGDGMARLYFETPYVSATDPGTTTAFMVDDIRVASVDATQIEDLPAIFEEFAGQFPVGVAIDSRETLGSPGDLTLRHFNQLTAENHMKVEAWYDAERNFRMNPEAIEVMDFAQANGLRMYGHVLLWHSQTPDWFFQDDDGQWLTDSPEDQAFLAARLAEHIDNVAAAIEARYGPFGSATNPLVAWDVVNEVVDDQANAATDGLRNSRWFQIMGEDYIDLAFELADEAFNGTYAVADDVDPRPVTLFINDYNTEQSGKQGRYVDLVTRLLGRDVPIDGVGHQFHVSLSTPVENLDGALDRFASLPVVQAVTELDVTVGGSPSEALLVEQGYYFRDAFRYFREHADDLFSVTIWGLTDNRSWRSEQAPLVFTGSLRAKPAYHGIMDGDLPALIRTANVFAGDIALGADATTSPAWRMLPLHPVGGAAQFQLRWAADHLTAYVTVDDASVDAGDEVAFEYAGSTLTFGRDGSGDVPGTVAERAGGYDVVVHLPGTFAQGATLGLDVRVTNAGAESVAGWNTPGELGTLTLVEPLSFTAVAEAPTAPAVDGDVDDVWSLAEVVTTDKQVSGSADGAATAEVRTLWSGDGTTLYVLADVTDAQLNAEASNPWDQDSVELYIDRGNYKNGSYRYDDNQIRIDVEGDISFGSGDEAFQEAQVDYEVRTRDGGYVVEAAINLLDANGGPGTFHGVDFQVNDATDGVRNSVRNWADPTGLGYQSTARWGVAKLVPAAVEGPTVVLGLGEVTAGGTVPVTLEGFEPGGTVELFLSRTGPATAGVALAAAPGDTLLGSVVVDAEGRAATTVTIPARTAAGSYWVNVEAGSSVLAGAQLRVLAADPAAPGGGTGGQLPRTGSELVGLLLTSLLLVGLGAGLVVARRPFRRTVAG